MKKKYLIASLWLLTTTGLFAQLCPPAKSNQRDLVILPDTAGEEAVELLGKNAVNGFQTGHAAKLILAQASPLLIELSIWKRFVRKIKSVEKSFIDLSYAYYKIDNFILCIPNVWLKRNPSSGFHLDALERIENPYTMRPGKIDALKGLAKSVLMLVNVYSSVVNILRTILADKSSPFNWNIVLFGHGGPSPLGSYSSRIAGVPFHEFKKLLKFLNHEINTNIFLYQTCYAGSKWLLKSYETNGIPDIYNYPIILTGLSEAPAYSGGGYQTIAIYRNFFKKIKDVTLCRENEYEIGSIAGILLQAFTLKKRERKLILARANNLLQIRWPGSSAFQVIEVSDIVQTTRQLVAKSLDTIQASAFVIDTPLFDTAIALHTNVKHIVSTTHTKWHFIKSITLDLPINDATQFMHKTFSYFTGTKSLKASKAFLIDKITNKQGTITAHNVIVFINSYTPHSILFFKDTEIFYMINGQGYRWDKDDKEPKRVDAQTTRKYLDIFEKEKKALFNTATL